MEGGEITGNSNFVDGGGVIAHGTGKFIMKDGRISGNECSTQAQQAVGGGVYVSNSGVCLPWEAALSTALVKAKT